MARHPQYLLMKSFSVLASIVATFFAVSTHAQGRDPVGLTPPSGIAEHSYFFAGGSYAGDPNPVMHGQMFVEKLTPSRPRQRFPIVLIHGGAQTATNWMGTPDGREGWAEFFCSQGYVVYMVDQPTRGRSAWHPGIDGKVQTIDAVTVEKLFTATELYNIWPQARLHTQWPGDGPKRGQIGDPVFDQFYASQVQYLARNSETQMLARSAGAALLDRIGPAIL